MYTGQDGDAALSPADVPVELQPGVQPRHAGRGGALELDSVESNVKRDRLGRSLRVESDLDEAADNDGGAVSPIDAGRASGTYQSRP